MYLCPMMSTKYIENYFDDIKTFVIEIEIRGDDEDCTKEKLLIRFQRLQFLNL